MSSQSTTCSTGSVSRWAGAAWEGAGRRGRAPRLLRLADAWAESRRCDRSHAFWSDTACQEVRAAANAGSGRLCLAAELPTPSSPPSSPRAVSWHPPHPAPPTPLQEEYAALYAARGMGLTTWSPLSSGILTGGGPAAAGERPGVLCMPNPTPPLSVPSPSVRLCTCGPSCPALRGWPAVRQRPNGSQGGWRACRTCQAPLLPTPSSAFPIAGKYSGGNMPEGTRFQLERYKARGGARAAQ